MPTEDAQAARDRLGASLAAIDDVRLGFLFGSRGRGEARPESDFDVGVLVDQASAEADRGRLVRRLAGRLGREVSSTHLDIVVLNDAPSLLRHRVLRDGIVLYARTREDLVRFRIKTIREYQDGWTRRQEFTRKRVQRLRKHETDGGPGDLLEKARRAARLLAQAERLHRD